jgi:hypothetical protein
MFGMILFQENRLSMRPGFLLGVAVTVSAGGGTQTLSFMYGSGFMGREVLPRFTGIEM